MPDNNPEDLFVSFEYPLPIGREPFTYYRVSDNTSNQNNNNNNTSNDLKVLGKRIITRDENNNNIEFDSSSDVFTKEKDDEDVFKETLPQYVQGFVHEGFSICIFVIGSSNSNKRRFLDGDNNLRNSHGLIEYIGRHIFDRIEAEIDGDIDMTDTLELSKFNLTLSCLELYDETYQDLLYPQNTSLKAQFDAKNGAQVIPLHEESISNEEDCIATIRKAKKNRNKQNYNFGNANEFTSCIFDFNMIQKRKKNDNDGDVNNNNNNDNNNNNNENQAIVKSRLTIVEVPSTEFLTYDLEDLRINYGPRMHKGLFAFSDVCSVLQDYSNSTMAPFSQSKLTYLLTDLLGGNCYVVNYTCLTDGESISSLATLQLSQRLQKSMNYPNVNTEELQGVLIKYRAMIAWYQDRIQEASIAQADDLEIQVMEKRLKKLELELMETQTDRNTAKDHAGKVYRLMELLKAKYNKLVEEKTLQSKELIESEEGKLNVARTLLELKLKYTELQEEYEKEKYKLEGSIVTAKHELCDLEIKVHEFQQQSIQWKESYDKTAKERDELQIELGTIHANFVAMRQKVELEQAKNVDLGSELLSLGNANSYYEQKVRELTDKCAFYEKKMAKLDKEMENITKSSKAEAEELYKEREKMDRLREEKIKLEHELERNKIIFEQNRLHMETSKNDFLKEKDSEAQKLQRTKEVEIKKLELERDDVATRLKGKENELKHLNRQIRDLRHDIDTKGNEMNSVIVENNSLKDKIESNMRLFRRRLGQLLEDTGLDTKIDLDEEGKTPEDEKFIKNRNIIIEEMVGSYRKRENNLLIENQETKSILRDLRRKHRVLLEKNRALRDIIEDYIPDHVPKDTEVSSSVGEEEERMSIELDNLNRKLEEANKEIQLQEDKKVQMSELHGASIQKLEAKVNQDSQAIAILRAENESMKKSAETSPSIKKLEDMQKVLMDQLSVLRDRPVNISAESMAGGDPLSSAERAELLELRRSTGSRGDKSHQINMLKAEVARLVNQIKAGGGAEPTQDAGYIKSIKDENDYLRKQLETARSKIANPDENLMEQLRNSEKRAAHMMSKATRFEEELYTYKSQMEMRIPKYKVNAKG